MSIFPELFSVFALALECFLLLGLEEVMCFYPHTVCLAVKDTAVSQSSFPETPACQERKNQAPSMWDVLRGLWSGTAGSEQCALPTEKVSRLDHTSGVLVTTHVVIPIV